jgi:hypothetical protein
MSALTYISLKQNAVLDLAAGTAAASTMSVAIPRATTPGASDSADHLFFYIVNGDTTDKTFTVLKGVSTAPTTRGGTANTDLAVTISHTAGGGIVGPIEVNRFAQADGSVNLTFSGTTSVTISAYMLPSRR